MTTPSYADVHRRLVESADAKHAESARRFFKTGPGQYGEGDKFLGIRVPVLRELVREYGSLSLRTVVKLLKSPWHEERALAALMLVRLYGNGGSEEREAIYRLYLDSLNYQDYSVILGLLLVTSAMVVAGSLLADVLYAVADPRIRLG